MPWEKQFDEGQALESAMKAFWSGGYEGTSITELLDQMGIQKGSFYATFGSKHQVLVDALESYISECFAKFEVLLNDPSPRTALENHLKSIAIDACGCQRELGCFVVNIALELAPKDETIQKVVVQTFEKHENLYFRLLESAKEKVEIAKDFNSRSAARALLAMVIGIRVLARASVSPTVIESIRDQALQLLGNSRQSGK